MYAPLARSDYCETSAPPNGHQLATDLPASELAARRSAGRARFLGRWETAEVLDVDGEGSQDVLDVDASLASVAAVVHVVAVGELVDRSRDSGADRVAGLPFGCLLLGTDAELQVTKFS